MTPIEFFGHWESNLSDISGIITGWRLIYESISEVQYTSESNLGPER